VRVEHGLADLAALDRRQQLAVGELAAIVALGGIRAVALRRQGPLRGCGGANRERRDEKRHYDSDQHLQCLPGDPAFFGSRIPGVAIRNPDAGP
jgi:hypothetical protein